MLVAPPEKRKLTALAGNKDVHKLMDNENASVGEIYIYYYYWYYQHIV